MTPRLTLFSSVGDIQIKQDEYPRHGLTMDALSKLRTAFKEG